MMVTREVLEKGLAEIMASRELVPNRGISELAVSVALEYYQLGMMEMLLAGEDGRHPAAVVNDSVRKLRGLGARVAIDGNRLTIDPKDIPVDVVSTFQMIIERDAPNMAVVIEASR